MGLMASQPEEQDENLSLLQIFVSQGKGSRDKREERSIKMPGSIKKEKLLSFFSFNKTGNSIFYFPCCSGSRPWFS